MMTGQLGSGAKQGRLLARPGPPPGTWATGVRPLGLGQRRDGLLMLPDSRAQSMPLLLLLHGAGGHAAGMLRIFEPQARQAGIALLVPESRGPSWDVIMGGFGPDVAFLDAALAQAFAACPADPHRLAIGGFSDGASYALSLGIANGDLFRWVLAFSPGFATPPSAVGKPRIYISHGKADDVLPIDRCSRRLMPRLRNAGYDLHYEEFDGRHFVPEGRIAKALALLGQGSGTLHDNAG
jgi:phospholipase/carboxylesterase